MHMAETAGNRWGLIEHVHALQFHLCDRSDGLGPRKARDVVHAGERSDHRSHRLRHLCQGPAGSMGQDLEGADAVGAGDMGVFWVQHFRRWEGRP